MKILPCMGGWCAQRDRCAHYVAGDPARAPAERLCEPGHDEPEALPVQARREVGTWEKPRAAQHLAPATWADALLT